MSKTKVNLDLDILEAAAHAAAEVPDFSFGMAGRKLRSLLDPVTVLVLIGELREARERLARMPGEQEPRVSDAGMDDLKLERHVFGAVHRAVTDSGLITARTQSEQESYSRMISQATSRVIQAVAAHRDPYPPPGWFTFGTHVDTDVRLEFYGTDAAGMPIWERPVPQAPTALA